MAETTRNIDIECLRFNPQTDEQPRYQTYEVPFTDDMSVLQGLQYIKDELDGSLTFRWSCRMAICGSCGSMVNGIPQLSCHTFLRNYYPEKVRVEPLSHFPILRDLAIDQTDFVRNKLPAIKPQLNLDLSLGPRITLAEAHRRFPSQLRELDEKPDAVFFTKETGTVWFLYGTVEDVRLLLAQTPGSVDTFFAKKIATQGTRVDFVSVNGDPGLYLSGRPHFVMLVDRSGRQFADSVRLVQNVLVWSHAGVAYRLEGELTKAKALELAAKLR